MTVTQKSDDGDRDVTLLTRIVTQRNVRVERMHEDHMSETDALYAVRSSSLLWALIFAMRDSKPLDLSTPSHRGPAEILYLL